MASERSPFRWWSSVAAVCLALGAGSAWTQDLGDDRRLDILLRALHRTPSGPPAGLTADRYGSPERVREWLQRLHAGTRRRRASEPGAETVRDLALPSPRLNLLVKYGGSRESLEAAGFRVQAQAGRVYTGTLDPGDLERLLALREVALVHLSREIEAPRPSPALERRRGPGSAFAAGWRTDLPGRVVASVSGAGAIVGIVDTGVDVFHQDFRKPDGTTRILYLLDFSDPGDIDEDGELDGIGPFGGTLYTEADINAALASPALMRQKDTTGHGTHGLSAAAGDDPAFPGMAPAADLVVVKATREDGSLGFHSADIVNALSFIDAKAAELGKPYVANLSLGTLLSSHDGRSLEEQAIDAIFGPGIPGKAVVIAAGNSSENGTSRFHHFQGASYVGLESGHTLTVPAYTPNPDRGNDRIVLDVWYEGRDKQGLALRPPASRPDCTEVRADFGEFVDVKTPCGDVFIANVGGPNPENGDVEAVILLDDWSGTAPAAGNWTVVMRGEEIGQGGRYDGWLGDESQVGAQRPYLSGAADNRLLVGKPGGAYNAITVGSHAQHAPATRFRTSWTDVHGIARVDTTAVDGDLSDFSSPGGTRDGRTKPELAAPGERVLGAVSKDAYPGLAPNSIYRYHPFPEVDALVTESTPEHAFGLLQGTSFAAPVVSGLAARILSTDPTLDAIQVRNVLVNSALADAFTGPVPNERWGYGKASEEVGGPPLPSDLRITVDALPDGVKGTPYNLVLTASGGALPYTWSRIAGALPPGLVLEGQGLLTGTPTSDGTFAVTLQVEDASVPTRTASRSYSLLVAEQPELAVRTVSLPAARIDHPYEAALEAEGGTKPYAWSLAGGSLPDGISLLGTGALDGTPETLGTTHFTVRVQDSLGAAAFRSLRLKVVGEAGDEWDPLGKSTPTVNQIAIDPADSSRVFVSTRNIDAVFETTNGGDSWRATSINNNLNSSASFLRISPSSTAWAGGGAGTYRFERASDRWDLRHSSVSAIDFDEAGAIYLGAGLRSGDDGETWTSLGSSCGSSSLSVFRSNPNVIYGTGWGTCRTDDGGASWADVSNLTGAGTDIRVNQEDPFDVVKANGFVYRTRDGGRNWATHTLPFSATCLERSLAIPSLVLAGTTQGLFKSSDHGQSWRELRVKGLSPYVSAVALDEANPDNYYVGTDLGVFHSLDGGLTWTLQNTGLIRRTLSAVALSRSSPSDVLLFAAEGAYVSRTSGDAWTPSREGLTASTPRRMIISPSDPNLFYLSDGQRLFRSDNRGVTWFQPNETFASGFTIMGVDADPFDANVIVMALSGTRGVYRSSDRGLTWSPVNEGLPFIEPTEVVFAKDVPGRLYLAFRERGVYRSDDRGDSWAPFALGDQTFDELEAAPSDSTRFYGRAGTALFYRDPALGDWQSAATLPTRPALDLTVDSADALTAWLGVDHSGTAGEAGGVYKTTDGGRNWARLPGVLDAYDVVGVAAHPKVAGTVYAVTLNAGVYRSSDGGATWTELSNYGTIADLTNVTVQDPSNPNVLFAGTEGYGIQISPDKGRTFFPRVAGLTNFYVNAIAFDPEVPSTVYAGTDAGIFQSVDGGTTWTATGQTIGEITDIVTDNEGTTRRIWSTVKGQGVAVSEDGGATFAVSATGLTSLDLTSLEVELIGATRRIWSTTKGGDGVAYSDDLGHTWKSAGGNGLTDRNVNDLAVESGTTRRIWSTTDTGVFYSDNDGLSWTDLSVGLPSGVPVTSVTVDPNSSEVLVSLFSESEGGVFRGGNLRGAWTPFRSGLDELKVRRLTRDRGHVVDATTLGTTLYAATAGDGVYTTEIQTSTASPLSILTAALPDGVLRAAYSASLLAEGGIAPRFWSLAEGTLPPGLGLDATSGAISGQPGQEGLFGFTLQVADSNGAVAQRALSIEIRNPDTKALSIADVAALEGDSGTKALGFAVSLSPASAQTVSVHYATADGTATAGSDYVAASGTLTFAPGELVKTVPVDVSGDPSIEPDETFFVDLDTATGAAIADARGEGRILDDDAPPTLSINDASAKEGDAGTVNVVFAVSLSRPLAAGVTVAWATADGSAAAGSDYVAGSGVLTFLPGTTSQPITLAVDGDTVVEPDETFFVDLSDAVNAAIADGQGQATIVDEDGIPTLSVADTTSAEGQPIAVFPITLSTPVPETVEVSYRTVAGTAASPGDYKHASGTLVFSPGTVVRTVPVTLADDGVDEAAETFSLELSDPVGATLTDGHADATILDDDLKALSVTDVDLNEGDSGTTSATFTLSLSAAGGVPIAVDYQTEDATATGGSDFVATAGTAAFPVGTTSATVVVPVNGDTGHEPDEGFTLKLRNPLNVSLAGTGPGPFWASVAAAGTPPEAYTDGGAYDAGTDRLMVFDAPGSALDTTRLQVLVNASGASGPPTWTTVPITTDTPPALTSNARAEYDGLTNRLIVVGSCSYASAVAVLANANGLGGPAAWIALPKGPLRADAATAFDPTTRSLFLYGGYGGDQGCSGFADDHLWVLRDADGYGTPHWERLFPTGDPPASRLAAAAAFDPASNRLIVHGGYGNAGYLSDVWVLTHANGLGDPPRWVRLFPTGPGPSPRYLHSAVYEPGTNRLVVFGGYDGTGVRNDAWVLTHANGMGGEPAWVPLKPGGAPPGARYRAAVGLARTPFDRMVVGPGLGTSGAVNDVFLLGNPASGAVPDAASLVARGVIRNDDPLPVVSVADATTVAEGNSGTRDAVFDVSLSPASAEVVTVAYATRDDDAVGGLDYVSIHGVLTIPPGTASVSLRVPVKGDPFPEADEAFALDLLHAKGAAIGNSEGRVVVADDDPAANPAPYVSDLAPLAVLPGSPGFDLTVHGANFLPSSVVRWNGASRPTTYVSSRELRAAISADDVAMPRSGLVTVQTPGPGGGVSEPMPLLVTAPSTLLSFTRSDIAAGDGPQSLGTGDLDGDGKPDLAVANTLGDTVSVWLGDGDGTFAPRADYPTVDAPHALAVADLDGNGRSDVAVLHDDGEGTLSVFLSNADGTLGARRDFPTVAGATSSSALAVGDFNRDGRVDVALSDPTLGAVRLLLGYGDGDFLAPGYAFPVVLYYSSSVAAGDFTGDGRLDLAVGSYSNTRVLPGNGDGGFGQGPDLGRYSEALAVADFNHDGHLDLAASQRGGYYGYGLNSGDGTAFSWVYTGLGGTSVLAPDLNGDGNADLVTTSPYGSQLDTALLDASGYAFSGPSFPTAGGPLAVAAADFDGDGKLDLAASNPEVDQVSILLNAPSPTLAVSDATLVEGNTGMRNIAFTVALTPATAATVTVDYATADGTATSGLDYGSVSDKLTFTPGTTTQTIGVPVFGDRDFELDETFFLNLSNPTAAEVVRAQGLGTILNDETGYALSVSDVSASEGGIATFTVSMPVASPQTVTVDYATADGTAVAGVDYSAASGTLTFVPGVTSRNVGVALLQDALDEADETLLLRLSGAVNALITDGDGQATALDDDPEPGLTLGDASVTEGNSVRTVELTATLSAPSGREVSVRYATADGTAKAGTDYLPASGTLVFSPGITARKVTVTIVGDQVAEPSEGFPVDLSEPRNATLADGEAVVTIADDDTLAKAEITSPPPGSSLASSTATFTWTAGSGAVQYWLSVGTTPGGTQIYDASQGTSLQQTVPGLPTDGSTVHVRLWSLLGTEWAVNDYWYVAAGGAGPALSIAGATVTEGDAGTTNATFTVTLAPTSGAAVTVGYATSDGTAAAGSDYSAASGTLTFSPQQATQTLTVPVLGDVTVEPDETFTVTLSDPVNAVVAPGGGQAVGTILNDDSLPGFYTVIPCRVLDTREPDGPRGGPALAAGADRTFTIAGPPCGIPAGALAASVNLTVTGATAAGNLRLYPADVPLPEASSINYSAGLARANNAIVPLSELGDIKVRCSQASGTVHFILDVNGYFQGTRAAAAGGHDDGHRPEGTRR
jgi:photosystem II stability/assembly factor-like uncharacterized protein